jgi:ribonuclease VapC
MERSEITMIIEGLIEAIIPFDASDAYANAELVAMTKTYGLSLGDRACIALGFKTGYPVYTSDKDWSRVDFGCKIIQIR